MIELKITKESRSGVLAIKKRCTVEYAQELLDALTEAAKETQRLEVKMEGLEDIDLSSLQLFYAAHRIFRAQKKELVFRGPQPGVFRRIITDAGLTHFSASEHPDSKQAIDLNWIE